MYSNGKIIFKEIKPVLTVFNYKFVCPVRQVLAQPDQQRTRLINVTVAFCKKLVHCIISIVLFHNHVTQTVAQCVVLVV